MATVLNRINLKRRNQKKSQIVLKQNTEGIKQITKGERKKKECRERSRMWRCSR